MPGAETPVRRGKSGGRGFSSGGKQSEKRVGQIRLPVEAAEGPLIVVVVSALALLGVLLNLVGRLGLLVLFVKGDGELHLLLVADDRQGCGVAGLIVAGQGGS